MRDETLFCFANKYKQKNEEKFKVDRRQNLKMSRLFCSHLARRFASRLTYSEHGPASNVIKIEHFDDPTEVENDKVIVRMLGMISHKKSLITIFGHKHFRQKFHHNFDIFHEKISTAFVFGLNLDPNC